MRERSRWMRRAAAAAIVGLLALCVMNGAGVMAEDDPEFKLGETIYKNPLSGPEDVEDWVIESKKENQPVISTNNGRMRLMSDVNFLLWCPKDFPDDIAISWDFLPQNNDGLAMFWFMAKGRKGEDLFDPSLAERTGDYGQYTEGDINAYHTSYFRRNPWDNPKFNAIKQRKSHGFELLGQGGNPIPHAMFAKEPYRMQVIKSGPHIRMSINDITVIDVEDEDYYEGGKIGFRQMAKLVADYSNLKVQRVKKVDDEDEDDEEEAEEGEENEEEKEE